MQLRVSTILIGALLCLAPMASWADLAPYTQDFEGLTPAPQPEDPFESSLGDDGWLLWANVWDAFGNYLYNYGGPYLAPNHGEVISAVVGGQGGPAQGAQQLSVFNDYRNGDHGACDLEPPQDSTSPSCKFIEINVFQEQRIGTADVGSTWLFEFDAKRGNIEGATTALGFIKTIHPTEFWLSRFITVDMTGVPVEWGSYSLSIPIDPDLDGHILQIGFLNTATDYEGSGVFYDNINFGPAPLSVSMDIKPGSCPNPINTKSRGVLPVSLLGSEDFDVMAIDVDSLTIARADGVGGSVSILDGPPGPSPSYYDTSTPFDDDDTCGCHGMMGDGFADLSLHFSTQMLTSVLELGLLGRGESVELVISGVLDDGTAFEGSDCVVRVPVGDQDGPPSINPTNPDGVIFGNSGPGHTGSFGEASTGTDAKVKPGKDGKHTK